MLAILLHCHSYAEYIINILVHVRALRSCEVEINRKRDNIILKRSRLPKCNYDLKRTNINLDRLALRRVSRDRGRKVSFKRYFLFKDVSHNFREP